MAGWGRDPDDETSTDLTPAAWSSLPTMQQPSVNAPPQAPAPIPPQPAWTPPPQPVWTPPQQQSWAQQQQSWPQQQQWPQQQPWAYPPASVQPSYWAAPREPASSPLATTAAVILLVVSILAGLVGLVILFVGAAAGSILPFFSEFAGQAEAISTAIVVAGTLTLFVSVLGVTSGIGVFAHKSWARWMGVAVGAIGVVLGFLLLIGTFATSAVDTGGLVLSIIWLAVNGFVVVALAVASDHFQPAPPVR